MTQDIQPKVERSKVLYANITDENQAWLKNKAKAAHYPVSEYVDLMLTRMREQDAAPVEKKKSGRKSK